MGPVQVGMRATELDDDGVTVLSSSGWVYLNFQIVSDTSGGGEGGAGGAIQQDPDPYTAPVIDAFYQTKQTDVHCAFAGHVSGSAVSGATVTFSGVLSGLNATVDSDGYFTADANFFLGMQGIGYAQVTDGQGNTTDMASIYVDIPDTTA